jgi:predicted CXXCH cytochrome family protein
MRHVLLAAGLVFALAVPGAAAAAEVDCLQCHDTLKKGKVVHPAVEMGCPTCHTGVDAADVPHKMKDKTPKGLSSDQPDLCYGCHDQAMFTKKDVHPALGMGCTTCHSPHSTDNMDMLLKKPVEVCLDCHPDIPKKPHAIAGFSAKGHPLGLPPAPKKPKKDADKKAEADKKLEKEPQQVMDPVRKDKPFYCGSCHNPHSSDSQSLFRYKAASAMDLCVNCHKM